MKKIKFKPSSKPYTLGIELEVRLVCEDSYKVANSADLVFENLPKRLKKQVHIELLRSMVEIVTPVCDDVDEAVKAVEDIAGEISNIGKKNGFKIVAIGTHAFENVLKAKITDSERYNEALKEFQIVVKKFLICGLHIHVGMKDEFLAIKAYNTAINYLPIFLALSASSPFFDTEFTGLCSYRTKIFEMLPRAGIPEYFDSFEDMKKLYDQLHKSKMIKDIKDVWWDVRVHPDFGTVELRVCDAVSNMKRLKLITVLFQALCVYSEDFEPKREYAQILKQNKWNAARYSLEGVFMEGDKTMSIREKALELVKDMKATGVFKKLKTEHYVEDLKDLIKQRSIAQKMIEKYEKSGDLKVIEAMGTIG